MTQRTAPQSPLDTSHAQRGSEKVERYNPIVRLLDWHAGFADGRRLSLSGADRPLTTAWLLRNADKYLQTDRKELLACHALCAPLIEQLQTARATEHLAEAALARSLRSHEAIPKTLDPSAETARGPAEHGDHESTIRTRRNREHRSTITKASVELRNHQQALTDSQQLVSRLGATIDAAYATARIRTLRRREHHQRRAHVYLRALSRRQIELDLSDREMFINPVPIPHWTDQPCPWLSSHKVPSGVAA